MKLHLGAHEITPLSVVAATLVVSAIAVLVVVAVMLPSGNADTIDSGVRGVPDWVTPERLIVPDEGAELRQLQWVPHRPRREIWSDDDAAEYWLDPAQIGLDVLEEQVEAYIRRLFEEVP